MADTKYMYSTPKEMEEEEGEKTLTYIMDFYGRVPRPNMIFSVIGDSDNLIPKPWPKSRFQQSLIYAAKAAGECWILSKGEPLTVSKIIREMMEEYIYLDKAASKSLRLISVPSRPVEDTSLYFDLPEALEDDGDRDKKNQTHQYDSNFINLPVPSEVEDYLEFRIKLEETLERPTDKERNALVVILVEGDLSVVDHVKLAIGNGIPVLFVKGTGGLADLMSISIQQPKDASALELRTLLPTLFGIQLGDKEIEELEASLNAILERPYLVGVFDLLEKNEEEFASTVGELVQKSWLLENAESSKQHKNKARDMKNKAESRISSYALEENWQREEKTWHMSKKHETLGFTTFSSPFSLPLDLFFRFSKFLELKRENPSSEKVLIEAQDLLKTALLTNRTDYVNALLDLNLPISEHAAAMLIDNLYKNTLSADISEKSDSSGMSWVLMEMEKGKEKLAKHLFEGETDCHKIAQKMCKRLLNYKKTEDPRLFTNCRTQRRKEYLHRQNLLQAVLLWSLLTRRTDIATLVWRRVANQLYTGLVSALILQKMSSIAKLKDKKLSVKLKEQSKVFRSRVLSMMDDLYQTDEVLAFEILDELDTVWTIQAKPQSFAYESKMYDIIAHPCSVGLLDKIWYNGLIPSGKRFCADFLKQPYVSGGAPCFHFALHYFFFGIILLMYSYVVLTPLKRYEDMSWVLLLFEFSLYIWTGLDFFNDIIGIIGVFWRRTETRRKGRYRFLSSLNDMWKLLGLVCAILVVSTVMSRRKPTKTFRMANRWCALLLLFSYLRYMRVFVIHKYTGITFLFLKHMLLNLVQFLITIAFFVLGVGIFIEAMIHRNQPDLFPGKWYDWRIWRIIYYPFYQYYGETFDDALGIEKSNEEVDWSVKALAAIHMMVGNLLIVNVIVALFTTTYEKVLKKSGLIWQYERYHVIKDFRRRTLANLDYVIPWRLIQFCKRKRKDSYVQKELVRTRERQILQYIMAGRSLEK
ncbi:transient receptor potential cation channel subfamily M member 5-like isoform X2 [Saccostrea cucullata]|uniref:transient receptor potential cation channel subfamily M member 5-like isoform X2 n=1 Tax=Saccostrea cuccullata TaxID=36930 RepID=UPI002ED11462